MPTETAKLLMKSNVDWINVPILQSPLLPVAKMILEEWQRAKP